MSIIELYEFMQTNALLVEMANLHPDETGVRPIINIVNRGGARHGARVKVSNVPGKFQFDDNFSVTLEDTPRVVGACKIPQNQLKDVVAWVKKNRNHLTCIWNDDGSMTNAQLFSGFVKL